jgi:gas vesicle protein
MNTKTKVAIGILGAAAAGVVIGLLIAPEKGSEMRKKLKKTANGWADDLSNMFVKGKEEFEEVKNKIKGNKSEAEDKVNKIKESLSS